MVIPAIHATPDATASENVTPDAIPVAATNPRNFRRLVPAGLPPARGERTKAEGIGATLLSLFAFLERE